MLLGLVIKIIFWLSFAAALWWCYAEDVNAFINEQLGEQTQDQLQDLL